MKPIGDGHDRIDGRKKVTGQARYAADTPVHDVAHAVIVAATIARGRVTGIDVDAAKLSPGVLAVLHHGNAPKVQVQSTPKPPNERAITVLQDDAVRFDRQPIALVVADSYAHALAAAQLVKVTYALDGAPESALVGDANAEVPKGEDDAPRTRGDSKKALASAAAKISATYTTPKQSHNPMEPHATVAVWEGDKALTVYESTQGIFGTRARLASIFGLPKEHVRVISPFLGGGFGCKGALWSHTALAAMAARVVGKPVKLALPRTQMFGTVGYRPETKQSLTLGADKDGKLVGIELEALSITSRFDEFVERVQPQITESYACPNVSSRERLVRLDVGTPTYMRAPGESTGSFAIECAMDELAYALAMDPLALRLKNHADVDPHKNKPWTSKSLKECYKRAADAFGWAKWKPTPRAMRDGNVLVGWGMAGATYPAHVRDSSALARLNADGTATVLAGSQDIGTGTYTIMTQIAADELGVAVEKVFFDLGDTTYPEANLSAGSSTAASTGSAVKLACAAVRKKLLDLAIADGASPVFGAKPEDVVLANGVMEHRAHPGKGEPFGALLARKGMKSIEETTAKKANDPKTFPFSARAFGATFVEVRVDESLGIVRVSRAVAAFAAGRILNAKTARSQFLGGMVWGIGFALEEHMRLDARRARVVNADLSEYHVPVNGDVRALDVILVEEDDPHINEIGAKGIGEIGITGMPAAIANAVHHATGKRIRDLPITVEKLL